MILPTRVIVKIEELLKQPQKTIAILSDKPAVRDRVRGADMERIAFPASKKNNSRDQIVLENLSRIMFKPANENALRGMRYDLVILIDVPQRNRERIDPLLENRVADLEIIRS